MNFWNLLFLGKQNFYHKTHWYEALFAKVVGAGRKLIAKFLKIKGNTIVWNQLATFTVSTYTTNGITYEKKSDGTITVNGTAGTSGSFYNFTPTYQIQGHKILIRGCPDGKGATTSTWYLRDGYSGTVAERDIGKGFITTAKANTVLQILVAQGVKLENIVFTPQLFDLTAMFGAGKEPSTVEEFTSLFPLPYYQYEQGKLLSFGYGEPITWNQLAQNGNFVDDSGWSVAGSYSYSVSSNILTVNVETVASHLIVTNTISVTPILSHKYFVTVDVRPSASLKMGVRLFNNSTKGNKDLSVGVWNKLSMIIDLADIGNNNLTFFGNNSTMSAPNTVEFANVMLIDLTTMFGAGKEPSTVEEFTSMFPDPYYPYDSGSTKLLNKTGIKTVGFNQWDEEWELGSISSTTGADEVSTNRIRTVGYIEVMPNTSYYIRLGDMVLGLRYYDADKNFIRADSISNNGLRTTPVNCFYLRFIILGSTAYTKGNICISISGSKNGKYEPYQTSTLDIPTSTYFPTGMKSAGTVYDELTPSKAIKRVGSVDLGSLAWSYYGTPQRFVAVVSDAVLTGTSALANAVCEKYNLVIWSSMINDTSVNNAYAMAKAGGDAYVTIRDTSYSDAQTFTTAMNGVMLQFELAEEQVVNIDPPLELNYQVWNGGTEQLLPINTDNPTTSPILADIEYPDGERDDQYFTYRQYLPNSRLMSMALNTILGRSVTTDLTQEALDILMKGE